VPPIGLGTSRRRGLLARARRPRAAFSGPAAGFPRGVRPAFFRDRRGWRSACPRLAAWPCGLGCSRGHVAGGSGCPLRRVVPPRVPPRWRCAERPGPALPPVGSGPRAVDARGREVRAALRPGWPRSGTSAWEERGGVQRCGGVAENPNLISFLLGCVRNVGSAGVRMWAVEALCGQSCAHTSSGETLRNISRCLLLAKRERNWCFEQLLMYCSIAKRDGFTL